MAGFGKNSRGGKRGGSSSSSSSSGSSYVSTTTLVLVAGFCIYGVYMLTSSSSPLSSSLSSSSLQSSSGGGGGNLNPHKRTAIPSSLPRTALRDPSSPGQHLTTSGIGPEVDEQLQQQEEELEEEEKKGAVISSTLVGTEEDASSLQQPAEQAHKGDLQHHREEELAEERRQQDEEVEARSRRSDEEVQQDPDQQPRQSGNGEEDVTTNQPEDQQQKDGISGQSNEEETDQRSNQEQQEQQQGEATEEEKNDEQQQQQEEETGEEKNDEQERDTTEQNNEEKNERQEGLDQSAAEQNNDEDQQQQQQTTEQNSDEQIQRETNGEEGNRDEISDSGESQQRARADIEDIQQEQNLQQHIQQVTDGTHSQSEEEGGGITSQSQIEHDTDGTTEIHDQQQRQQQQQQQKQQQMERENTAIGGSEEDDQPNEDNPNAGVLFQDGPESAVPTENNSEQKTWATQADQSSNEKERRKGEESPRSNGEGKGSDSGAGGGGRMSRHEWELCNVTAGPDYIPCLDNEKAIKQLHSFRHFEHRERHCPEESPTCLVPLPEGYRRSIEWPQSRDRIWYNNVPRTKLAEVKGHQNWVKVTGEYLTFPGGGTQFIHGALHYIDFIQKSVPEIAWGKHTRVILDVGCGVASFGGYLFERDVLTMSFAPKDEHEAQVQFALERGVPAISAVMGSQRLPFPSRVFDMVHCARCRVPWHANDGALLLELNRVLRPGGFFVWSATPVYQNLKEDVEIWQAMTTLTKAMCWDLHTIKKDKLNSVGAAMYRKPVSNDCYDKRKVHHPPMCKEDDDPNAAWYVPLQSCMHRVPVDSSVRGSQWPQAWPRRLQVPPYWLNSSQVGVYGRPAPDDFTKDYEHWKRVVKKSYLNGMGIDWSRVRNVMDMRAVYGGFAAALKDMKVWVMNLVNIDSPDTLPIIYERGLFGMYHDWCESFSTYPRTYDLLHADRLFSQVKKRCEILPVMAEVDRIVRPGGKLIVRDESDVVSEVEGLLKSLHWEIRLTYSKNEEGILCAEKSDWRPEKSSASA